MTTEQQPKKSEKKDFLSSLRSGYCKGVRCVLSIVREYLLFIGTSIVFRRAGVCRQCGRCCRHVYLRDRGKLLSTFNDFLTLIKSDASLTHFAVRGQNEYGELYFACDHIGRDNTCSIYYKRPHLCRTYPDISMLRYGAVPKEDCGFYFINRFTGKKVL